MLIYIVRHGETDWNKEHRLQGQTDIPLNEQGLSLAEVTGKALREVPFDLCFSSPLQRAKQTADRILRENERYQSRSEAFLRAYPAYQKAAVYTESGMALIPEPRMIEINFGAWEGLGCSPDNMQVPEKAFKEFFHNPERAELPAGAEHIADVKKRAADFFHDLTSRKELADKTVLITTHGCAMRAFLHPLYQDESRFWQDHVPYNCEVAIVEAQTGKKPFFVEKGKLFYDVKLASNYKAT